MTEPVDGDVPGLPELEDVVGVPPAVVELAVGEAEELPAGVEERVEHQVEAGQPDHVVRYLWGDSVEKLRPRPPPLWPQTHSCCLTQADACY